jgi:hypothetical protein
MKLSWTKGRSVSDIANDVGVKARRIYEVTALLACFGVMKRKSVKARYRWNRRSRLKAPLYLPKRQAESPPSSIETRATRRRRREQEEQAKVGHSERSVAVRKLFPQLEDEMIMWHAPVDISNEVGALDAVFEAHALGTMIY